MFKLFLLALWLSFHSIQIRLLIGVLKWMLLWLYSINFLAFCVFNAAGLTVKYSWKIQLDKLNPLRLLIKSRPLSPVVAHTIFCGADFVHLPRKWSWTAVPDRLTKHNLSRVEYPKRLLNDWRQSWYTHDTFVGVGMTPLTVFRQTFRYSTLISFMVKYLVYVRQMT